MAIVNNNQRTATLRELGRPHVTAWLEVRGVKSLRQGDAADLMERVGAAIEAEQVALTRVSAASTAPDELIEAFRDAPAIHSTLAQKVLETVDQFYDGLLAMHINKEDLETALRELFQREGVKVK